MSKSPALLANVIRSSRIESQHFGHLVVVDVEGNIVLSHGDPHFVTYMRSAAKPFQAMPLFEDGIPQAFSLKESEQAVLMSSHNGETRHVDAVTGILKKIGRQPDDLQCGIHLPLGAKAAKALSDSGATPTVLHNNCSGKHAGMLAACVHHGWPLENYLDPDHPHQQRIHEVMARWAGLPQEKIARGIDGCSAPVFLLPLYNMALMYAKLNSAAFQKKLSHSNESGSKAKIAWRISQLFLTQPGMIAGDERFDTEIMIAAGGRVMAKTGAEGIECLGVIGEPPLGIAIKMIDGANRAIPPVLVNVLCALGALDGRAMEQLEKWRRVRLQNHRGIETGCIEAIDIHPHGIL